MKKMCILLCAIIALTGGCSNIPEKTETSVSSTAMDTSEAAEAMATAAESTDAAPAETTTAEAVTTAAAEAPPQTEESTEPAETAAPEEWIFFPDEEYRTYTLSDEDKEFLSRCVFVGDSICGGLRNYGIVPPSQVVAQGSTAARNIFDFDFTEKGKKVKFLDILIDRDPEYVVFFMGMNDVNMTSEKKFVENYFGLLEKTEEALPNATLIVLSVSPVVCGSKFARNERIDLFNGAIKEALDDSEKWYFVDISPEMKNSGNGMKKRYNGGDGVHLSAEAYNVIVGQLCEASGIFTDEPQPPTGLAAEEAEPGKVNLSWEPAIHVNGYELYMSTSENGDFKMIKEVGERKKAALSVSGLKTGKTYCFKLRSFKEKDGEKNYSEYSETITVTE